jgi:hypothetical protein
LAHPPLFTPWWGPNAPNLADRIEGRSHARASCRLTVAPAPRRVEPEGAWISTRPLPTRDPSPASPRRRDGRTGNGRMSLADALMLCELLAKADQSRYERAALRWLQRFIDERAPPLTELSLAASALAELRHGKRNVGIETLRRLLRRGG